MARTLFGRIGFLFVASLATVIATAQTTPPQTTPPAQPLGVNSPITAEDKAKVLEALAKVIQERAFVPGVDFTKWPEFVEKQRESLDKADTVGAFGTAVNQSLRSFGFSHIRLQSPQTAANRNRTTRNGIGVMTQPNEEGLVIRSVWPDSEADKAGLKVGDILLTSNGKPLKANEELPGDLGVKTTLTVKKAAGGDPVTVNIEVKPFSVARKDTLTWADEETAVIKIHTFSAGYSRPVIEGFLKEANAKAKRLIIDVRSNGGGAVNNLNHLLSLILPDGTEYGSFISRAVYNRYKEANSDRPDDVITIGKWLDSKAKTRSREGIPPFMGKLACLINRGSASASEITAAAIREAGGGVIVGTKSAGAVLASVYAPLPMGYALQHPVSDYVTIKGMRLEGNPIVPDAEPVTIENGDGAVAKAIEMMKAAGVIVR